jgi:hemolysin III
MPSPPPAARPSTRGEEIANTASHALALLLAIAGLPLLVANALGMESGLAVAGAAIFGTTTILLYLASTLYHAVESPRLKGVLRRLDHSAIYLLIAGTYTPITLGVLRGSVGWALLAVIWTLAVAGVLFKLLAGARWRRLSTGLYIAMGWIALAAIEPLWLHMHPGGLAWLFAGGVAYTGGVAFYLLHDRLRYSHLVWHLFVVAGTLCHFVVVWRYAN